MLPVTFLTALVGVITVRVAAEHLHVDHGVYTSKLQILAERDWFTCSLQTVTETCSLLVPFVLPIRRSESGIDMMR